MMREEKYLICEELALQAGSSLNQTIVNNRAILSISKIESSRILYSITVKQFQIRLMLT